MTLDQLETLRVIKIEWSNLLSEHYGFGLKSFGMTLSNDQTFSTDKQTNHNKSLTLDSNTKISRIEIFRYVSGIDGGCIGEIIFYNQNGKIIKQATNLTSKD